MSSDQDKNGAPRLAPRPISRPPVDAASRQAFSRPDGVHGPFVAETFPIEVEDSYLVVSLPGRLRPAA